MKKKLVFAALLSLLFGLFGCRAAGDFPFSSQSSIPNRDPFSGAGTAVSHTSSIAWVNWTEDPLLYTHAWNKESAALPGHLPVYVLFQYNDLLEFRQIFSDVFCWEQRYDEIPSTNDMLKKYNEHFFEDHTLFLVYIPSGSGSLRYAADEVFYGVDRSVCVRIKQTNAPEVFTCDMAGWLCAVELSKSNSEYSLRFDAVLGNTPPIMDEPAQTMPPDHEISIPSNTYPIQIMDPNGYLIEAAMDDHLFYTPGTYILLHTEILVDAELAMYINGEFHSYGSQQSTEDNYWTYRFEMPASAVEITFAVEGGGPSDTQPDTD